jgi:hypothetical protein
MNSGKGVGLTRHLVLSVALIAGLLLSITIAQAQSTGTVTATCKDGTSFTGAKRSGACRGHGGVQSWGAAPESSDLVNPAIEPASSAAPTKSTTQAQSAGTVTATCKDGTAFTGAKRSGACRGHGGVQSWGPAPESSGLVNPAIEPASTPSSAKSAAQAQGAGTVAATCKDGTSFTGTKRSGACRGHGGVQSWGAAEATTIPVNAPAQLATPAPATTRGATRVPAGNGQVWVNTDSHVYHCPGTRWYGKTKEGAYMSEAQAKGAKPDHGKACTS